MNTGGFIAFFLLGNELVRISCHQSTSQFATQMCARLARLVRSLTTKYKVPVHLV